jgi:PhnB protein
MAKNEAVFTKDIENKTITVARHFDAPLQKVWKAWTDSEILDQWWAPRPWKAETKSMDFREGGNWMYAMVGPDGEKHWNKIDYIAIQPEKSVKAIDMFCDDAGNATPGFPRTNWLQEFSEQGDTTRVMITLTYAQAADMEAILKMGFEEGFTMGLNNLDEYFAAHK